MAGLGGDGAAWQRRARARVQARQGSDGALSAAARASTVVAACRHEAAPSSPGRSSGYCPTTASPRTSLATRPAASRTRQYRLRSCAEARGTPPPGPARLPRSAACSSSGSREKRMLHGGRERERMAAQQAAHQGALLLFHRHSGRSGQRAWGPTSACSGRQPACAVEGPTLRRRPRGLSLRVECRDARFPALEAPAPAALAGCPGLGPPPPSLPVGKEVLALLLRGLGELRDEQGAGAHAHALRGCWQRRWGGSRGAGSRQRTGT